MREFDSNNYVNVKFTDFGIEIIRQYNENLAQINSKVRKLEIQVDENGYTPFQLLELMEIFGPYLHAGENLPFESTIMISEEYLKEPSVEKGKSL